MRRSLGWLALLLGCGALPALCAAAVDLDHDELIRQATAVAFRGFAPPKAEQEAAEAAMKRLEQDKEAVAAHILDRLQSLYPEPKTVPPHLALGPGAYGIVLRRFGPKHLLALEPKVLRSPNPRVRQAGLWILGFAHPLEDGRQVVDLIVQVLQRDESVAVQAAAIRAINNHRATDRHNLIVGYLASPHVELRRAAVGFYWSHPLPAARPALEALAKTETSRDVGFWLVGALAQYEDYPVASLLASPHPGIRQGAFHALGTGHVWRNAWKPALKLIEKETDRLCRAQLGILLACERHPQCIPLLIEVLRWKGEPRSGTDEAAAALSGRCSRVHARTLLCNITGIIYHPTPEERRELRRKKGSLYAWCAHRYEQWWRGSKRHIRWSDAKSRFVSDDGK